MFAVIAGPDGKDPTSINRPVQDPMARLEDGVKGLKIAVPENYFYDPVSQDVGKILAASLDTYRALGAEIVAVDIPDVELANSLTTLIIMAEAATLHQYWLRDRPDDYGRATLARMLNGLVIRRPPISKR